MQLFLDPFFLSKRIDKWSNDATLTLRSFFEVLTTEIRAGNEAYARTLFDHLGEPNSTCLGMSRGRPRGRGVGNGDTDRIFDRLIQSRAIQTGLLQDIEDSILFVENFGKDKLSDMTTNIITKHLIEYTQNQCELHDIPMEENIPSGYFWESQSEEWINIYTKMLVIGHRVILFVPKAIVSYCKAYTPEIYYNRFVLEFLQNENLRIRSALVQERNNGIQYVTKKDLKERDPQTKDFLRRFTIEHPEILQQFKDETNLDSLSDKEISDINIRTVSQSLIQRLRNITPGFNGATDFHNLTKGILEMIFYPHLMNPSKEREINQGRKRIDLVFQNASKTGIFWRLPNHYKIPCPHIFIECKNYSRDLGNPELDQMIGRFSTNRGMVGFVVCRSIEDMPLFLERCRDAYRDNRQIIIPIVDQDIITILENYNNFNPDFTERFLNDKIESITLA